MIKQYLQDDLVRTLLNNCHLTEVELDTLLCRKIAKEKGIKIKEIVKLRDKNTSFGSFDRSYKQGLTVLRRCVLTLLLADLLGLLGESFFIRLSDLSVLLKRISNNKTEANEAVKELIDDFSGKLLY